MRYSLMIFAFISCIVLSCSTQKKIAYEFPAAMGEDVRKDFTKECDKGQVLYNLNCAQCHNLVVKGKPVIPDFKPEQLIGYELRVTNAQHESSMPDTKVTAEELGQIMTFLSYKAKSNVPMTKGKQ